MNPRLIIILVSNLFGRVLNNPLRMQQLEQKIADSYVVRFLAKKVVDAYIKSTPSIRRIQSIDSKDFNQVRGALKDVIKEIQERTRKMKP